MAALEVLARVTALILDKTGTITFGRPELVGIERYTSSSSDDTVLALAAAVERHSLHPIAKAIVEAAAQRQLASLSVSEVVESVGHGIRACVAGHRVAVCGEPAAYGEMRVRCEVDDVPAATFVLRDQLKMDASAVFDRILALGIELSIATGDRREAAEHVVKELGRPVQVEAQCTPQAKLAAIERRRAAGKVVGMVGDGIKRCSRAGPGGCRPGIYERGANGSV